MKFRDAFDSHPKKLDRKLGNATYVVYVVGDTKLAPRQIEKLAKTPWITRVFVDGKYLGFEFDPSKAPVDAKAVDEKDDKAVTDLICKLIGA